MSAETEGAVAARQFRRDHHLGTQPLGDLITIIEQTTGIDVAVLDAGPDEHGLTMRDPARGAVFVAVARTDRPMRQRSTLAHELGHILFEDWTTQPVGSAGPRPYEEIRADAFARHLLIPVEGLAEVLRASTGLDVDTLSLVVQRFEVSPAVAAIALEQGGYIDPATKDAWRKLTTPGLAGRYGWSDQYRALQHDSMQARAPQRLLARAIEGYIENVVSPQTIAALRRVDAREVEDELRSVGVEPRPLTADWGDASALPAVDVDLSELDMLEDPGC
ncbi:ImmA/IrrE family metallo-endopeptidase [Prescottella subtropica]|uniref:ImmA/IrrE family metallo-endopeptidase n=1 Tax=Prescottella subtropica TaxID=2545757 RepID=UPI0010F814CA|nr:ImmA/IrrE family metallo-endopeptidase [Prescottella subtropica]